MKVEKETKIERAEHENFQEKSIRHQHHACNCSRSKAEIDENEMNISVVLLGIEQRLRQSLFYVKALLFCLSLSSSLIYLSCNI